MKKYGVKQGSYRYVPDISWTNKEYYDMDGTFGTNDINTAYQFKEAFDVRGQKDMEVYEKEPINQ